MKPRYTFIGWGDGYMVYDGDEYIGKDDQVDIFGMLVDSGYATVVDAEEKGDVLDEKWGALLPELLAALGEE